MNQKYIEDNDIVIKYLRKQLTDQELEAFEVYLMENPQALEMLEVEQALVDSVGDATKPEASFANWLSRFADWQKGLAFFASGAAASLLASAMIFSSNQTLSTYESQVVYLSPNNASELTRGASQPQSVIGERNKNLVLVLETGFSESDVRSVVVFDKSNGKKLLMMESLTTNGVGELTIVIPELIESDGFKLEVIHGNQTTQNFSIDR